MLTNEAENRGIDADLFHSLCRTWNESPVLNTLAVKLAYLGPGEMGLKLCPGLEYTTVKERVQGTVLLWIRLWVGPSCPWVIIVCGHVYQLLYPTFRDRNIAQAGLPIGAKEGYGRSRLGNNKVSCWLAEAFCPGRPGE